MNRGSSEAAGGKRTASKKARQQQLIRATIRSIAKNGLSATTMAAVSQEAGLSQGIVNLHFQSKDRLLVETLSFVVNEYRAAWEAALNETRGSSADKIRALVAVDFSAAVCDRRKLAVWFAFWGESPARPTYRKLCAAQDEVYRDVMADLCADVIRDGGYVGLDPVVVAAGLISMNQGLWLDVLLIPRVRSRTRARDICLSHLARVFPAHFRDPMDT